MIGGKVRLYIVGLKDTENDSHNNPICRRGDKSDYRSDATYSDEIVSFKDPELEVVLTKEIDGQVANPW